MGLLCVGSELLEVSVRIPDLNRIQPGTPLHSRHRYHIRLCKSGDVTEDAFAESWINPFCNSFGNFLRW